MHLKAIQESIKVFKEARDVGIDLKCLDIGGGFPINYSAEEIDKEIDIYEFCAPLRFELETLPSDVIILAEPGWFLVSPC